MVYDEDDLLPLSALQHLAFCARQCALIHIEGAWDENRLTALGRVLHERTHGGRGDMRDGVVTTRSLLLRSLRLGLAGMADVVEFHPVDQGGIALPSRSGLWQPFPVEYKRGMPKLDHCDEVQLCAQALCLEEMLQIPIEEGALYYGEPKRRTPVSFSSELRDETERLAGQLHELIRQGLTPPAVREAKCRSCSLVELCLPAPRKSTRSAIRYLNRMIKEGQQPLGAINDETNA